MSDFELVMVNVGIVAMSPSHLRHERRSASTFTARPLKPRKIERSSGAKANRHPRDKGWRFSLVLVIRHAGGNTPWDHGTRSRMSPATRHATPRTGPSTAWVYGHSPPGNRHTALVTLRERDLKHLII